MGVRYLLEPGESLLGEFVFLTVLFQIFDECREDRLEVFECCWHRVYSVQSLQEGLPCRKVEPMADGGVQQIVPPKSACSPRCSGSDPMAALRDGTLQGPTDLHRVEFEFGEKLWKVQSILYLHRLLRNLHHGSIRPQSSTRSNDILRRPRRDRSRI